MSDGSLSNHSSQQDRATIAICSFNKHDANILTSAINKLGLYPVLYNDSAGYYRLRFNYKDAIKLFQMITPYIPEVVRYKVSERFRDMPMIDISSNAEFGYQFFQSELVSKEEYLCKNGCHKYDLKTETGNYVVGNTLVHNSSGRSQNSLKTTRNNSFFARLLDKYNIKSNEKKSG